ncbi:MAG: M20/M25/M40 family metallo-hydrolase [Candidatus Coatesbacteria bacterium]|nr:MAG: M20/M25/M40 family metallo-hydrolase [Candidatus Coatesbacteria bacterium]
MRTGISLIVTLLSVSCAVANGAEDYLAEFYFDGDPVKFAELSVQPYVLTDGGFVGSVGANYSKELAARGIRFTVLDEDTEGKYYWVTETVERPGFAAAGITSAGAELYSTYERNARPAPGAYPIGPTVVDFRALERPGARVSIEYNDEVAGIVAAVTEGELMEYDTDLVDFVTRYSYTEELKEAADYIEGRLGSWGYTVTRDRYFGDNLEAVSAVDSNIVWAAGSGAAVFRTTDGGAFWSPTVFPPGSDLYSIVAVSPTVAACGGKGGTVYSTADGGVIWSETGIGGYVKSMRSCPNGYWAVNTIGRIYNSPDGLNWSEAAYIGDERIHDVDFDSDGNGVIVGWKGYTAYSDDGGVTWHEVSTVAPDRISAVAFADTGTVVAAGEGGYVARSTDGGATWTTIDLGTEIYFKSIAFPTPETGYLAGDAGNFYVSDDGGVTWTAVDDTPFISFEDMAVAGPGVIWLAPKSGGSLFHTDGADAWIDQAENADIASTSVWDNLTAVLPGSGNADAVLLTAHYDSTSNDHELSMTWAPGADDNATGVSALLAAAHHMAGHTFASDVYFVFFSGEENQPGLRGSSHYAPEVKYEGLDILGVINVDSIGWTDNEGPDLDIKMNGQSLWLSSLYQMAGSLYVPSVDTVRIRDDEFYRSDHAPFWRLGYPAVLVIEFEISLFINTKDDTQEKITPAFFTANAKTVVAAAASLAGPGGGHQTPDTLADVVVYPNPYSPNRDKGNSGLVFEGLPDGSTVEMYNVAGEKVFEAGGPSSGVLVVYPNAGAGENVASGVYIYRVSAPGGATAVGKVAIVK